MPVINVTPPPICDAMAIPPLPTLPSGVSLGTALPGIGEVFGARVCCRIFQLPVGLPPVGLGVSVQLPLVVALNTLIGQVNTYLRGLPMRCPKQP